MTFTTLQNKQSLQVPRIFPQKGIHVLTVYTLCQKSHTVGFLLLFLFSCDFCNILVPRAIFSNSFKSLKVSWAEGLGCHEWWNPMIMYSHCTVYKCRWWDSICHWFLSFCPEFYLGLLKEVRIFEEVCMQNATFLFFLTNLEGILSFVWNCCFHKVLPAGSKVCFIIM